MLRHIRFAIVCIFEGVRRIGVFGFSKSPLMSAALGFVYIIGYATISYSAHNLQLKAAAIIHKGIAVPEQAADWGADFSPIKRSEISIQIARVAFSEHGQLRYYFDEAGKRLLFAPGQADIDKREIRVVQLAQLDYAAQESSDASAAWPADWLHRFERRILCWCRRLFLTRRMTPPGKTFARNAIGTPR